jgi:hypothetical protein
MAAAFTSNDGQTNLSVKAAIKAPFSALGTGTSTSDMAIVGKRIGVLSRESWWSSNFDRMRKSSEFAGRLRLLDGTNPAYTRIMESMPAITIATPG